MSPTSLDDLLLVMGRPDDHRLAELFGALHFPVAFCEMLTDEDGPSDYRFLAVNRAFADVTGFRECRGRLVSEVTPNYRRAWARAYARAAFEREPVRTELHVEATDRWFDVSAVPVGPVGQFATIFREETYRHRMLKDLREREDRLRAVVRRERESSARLQRALLPDELVDDERVRVSAFYRAGSTQHEVGGDWYDTFRWPGGRVGGMVGDVVGHSLESAASMGRLRSAVAAIAPYTAGSPGGLMTGLRRHARGPDGSDFVTAACAVLDPGAGTLTYSRAGHPPPLLVGPGGDSRWLDDGGTPLGRVVDVGAAARDAADEEFAHPVPPGATVVLYSDGLVERRGEDLDERLGLLRDRVSAMPLDDRVHAATIAEAMLADDATDDDVVVLALQLIGEGASA